MGGMGVGSGTSLVLYKPPGLKSVDIEVYFGC